jgi:hypothetical protein
VDNVILTDIIAAIDTGDFEKVFRLLGFSEAATLPLLSAVAQSYERGGIFTGGTFPKFLNTSNGRAVFRFNVRDARAEAFLRDKSSSLVARLTDETRLNVQTTLQRGMQDGRNPRSVALDIVGRVDPVKKRRVGGIVGLTPNQENWVFNARRDLETLNDRYFTRVRRDKRFDSVVKKAIRSGNSLPVETVDRLMTRYKDRLLQYRGDMIGRTEAIQAMSASEHEAYRQAVDLGAVSASDITREWDSAGDTHVRFSHMFMDGQKRGLDEPFLSPRGFYLLYPGDTSMGADAGEVIACRCRAKVKVNWIGDG